MTYRGTIDEDKQILVIRPLNVMDKKLIRVAYENPELRARTIRIVIADQSKKLKEFAKDRKWKNPETSNLIGFDRVLELSSEDKMWAKAIIKKVTEEFQKSNESNKDSTSPQKSIAKKLQKDVEGEIAKFKSSGKDITNPEDRAEFEEYLDTKLRPAQEEIYREKIQEATGLLDDEYKKATKGLLGTGVKKAIGKTLDDLGLKSLASKVSGMSTPEVGLKTQIAGAGILGSILFSVGKSILGVPETDTTDATTSLISSAINYFTGNATAAFLSPLILVGSGFLAYKVYKNYKNTPESAKRNELKDKFNKGKEEVEKKLLREQKYKEIGQKEALNSSILEFYKNEKFDDEILGDDLTIKELMEISEDDDADLEDKRRATKLLEEKKSDFFASKYNRQKILMQETKGKKFKTPDGKRVDVKKLLEMEEDGDSWATEKLKDLRHTIEGPEEDTTPKKEEDDIEEEEEKDTSDEKILKPQESLKKFKSITQKGMEKELAKLDEGKYKELKERLTKIKDKKKDDDDDDDDDDTSMDLDGKNPYGRRPKKKSDISSTQAKTLLDEMAKIKKNQVSMESTYKNEQFENPDGKKIKFNTLKKIFGDDDHIHHEWAVTTWDGLKKKINKKGADQDSLINKIVKEKFESALTVDPLIVSAYKEFSKDGKFDEEKFNEMLKSMEELGKEMSSKTKKASLTKANLIKLAYENPELRRDILKLLK